LSVLGSGTVAVVADWVEPVEVLPFALLGLALTAPILTIGYGTQDLRLAREAAGRIHALLDTPILPVPIHPRTAGGHRVVFDGVGFGYDGRVRALQDVDLVLEPGTVTALVGPSGSGKSTLARMVPRFHDADQGRVLLGGVDVRELDPVEVYTRVGFVFQDVQLPRSSVADAIALGRPGASLSDVEVAARAAQVHDRIVALPRGYDSVLGEDAVLSGGEAQRVSIARALLADPPVLVMDEATSFADAESEAAVQDALSRLAVGRTVLVVAHRLDSVVGADQVVVLDGGRVRERGTHAELVIGSGWYARAWRDQQQVGEASGSTSPGFGRTVDRASHPMEDA
ncbi:MAG: ABC transporter ATP-binding protein, partial [Phycicoccus sp.]